MTSTRVRHRNGPARDGGGDQRVMAARYGQVRSIDRIIIRYFCRLSIFV